jgi:hypothetical protein
VSHNRPFSEGGAHDSAGAQQIHVKGVEGGMGTIHTGLCTVQCVAANATCSPPFIITVIITVIITIFTIIITVIITIIITITVFSIRPSGASANPLVPPEKVVRQTSAGSEAEGDEVEGGVACIVNELLSKVEEEQERVVDADR